VEAAFFDLDKTVIAKASMVAFGRPLYRHGLLSRWLLLRALYGQLVYLYLGADEARVARMRDSVVRLTRGWDQAHVRAVVTDTLAEVIDPIVYDEALDLIRLHQAAGRPVYLVSASPEEIVEPLARHVGVDGCIATRSAIDEHGRYAGEIEFYSFGPNKAAAIRDEAVRVGIDLSASYAYSDSMTDLPMLEVVGHPVAVNPDRDLLRVATERGWEIMVFSHKVHLRDRVSMPPAGPTAAVGGGLATIAAGLLAWWWFRRNATPPAPPPSRWQIAWDRVVVPFRAGARRARPIVLLHWPSYDRGGAARARRHPRLDPDSLRERAADGPRRAPHRRRGGRRREDVVAAPGRRRGRRQGHGPVGSV
jgi:HAD superfamily hydrolase (TIGR01490 family)